MSPVARLCVGGTNRYLIDNLMVYPVMLDRVLLVAFANEAFKKPVPHCQGRIQSAREPVHRPSDVAQGNTQPVRRTLPGPAPRTMNPLAQLGGHAYKRCRYVVTDLARLSSTSNP